MLDLQVASPVVLVIIAAVGIHTMDAAAALGVPAIDTRRETPVIGSHGGLAEEGQQAGGNQSLFHHISYQLRSKKSQHLEGLLV